MSDELFLQILNMSFTASIVIIIVLLIRLLLRKAPKVFSYALWSVVLFRLICPVSFESSWGLLGEKAIPGDIMYMQKPQINTGLPILNERINAVLPVATPYQSINPMQVWIFFGKAVWLIGILALLIYSVLSLVQLKQKLKASVHERENIYTCAGCTSPFVMGLFHPKIYLPAALTDDEREYIILHEQIHIRRGDHVVKVFGFLVLCLHWFNPLVWVAFFFSGRDMEMACDERVIKTLGNEVKKQYSTSLLALATGRKIVGGTPLAFGEGDTKHRIRNVLNYKKPAFWVIAVSAVAVAALAFGLLANPKPKAPPIDWVADLYQYRTQFVGDNTNVSHITDRLNMPETFRRTGLRLYTARAPYAITISYTYGPEIGGFDGFIEDQTVFDTNAIIAFSLIQNLDAVTFSVSTHETTDISRTRDWAESVMGSGLWEEASTLEGFQALLERMPQQLVLTAAQEAQEVSVCNFTQHNSRGEIIDQNASPYTETATELASLLLQGTDVTQPSISDAPLGAQTYWKIDLGGLIPDKIYYVYESEGKYWVEKPYDYKRELEESTYNEILSLFHSK